MNKIWRRIATLTLLTATCLVLCSITVFAVDDIWTVANRIIIDVYNKIAALSTVLAGLMTTVCVVGMKMSSNQQKVDRSIDWLKRIWVAWTVINAMGAFLAYIRPLLSGLISLLLHYKRPRRNIRIPVLSVLLFPVHKAGAICRHKREKWRVRCSCQFTVRRISKYRQNC